jgi:hypothetical protein
MEKTPGGMRVQSALYQVLNKEQAKLHKLLENFGLRPDARARVSTAIRAQLQLFEGGAQPGAAGTTGDASGLPAVPPTGFADF